MTIASKQSLTPPCFLNGKTTSTPFAKLEQEKKHFAMATIEVLLKII